MAKLNTLLTRAPALLLTLQAVVMGVAISAAENRALEYGAFAVEHELTLPGTPEMIYDAISGDISAWWDHTSLSIFS